MNNELKVFIENNLHSMELKILNLHHETLTISDYEWLGKMIQQSSAFEVINLPNISKDDAAIILSILDKATIKNSLLIDMEINFSSPKHEISKGPLLIKDNIHLRLKRNRKRTIGIHGGGNIGLGLFADIVSQSPFSYHMLATSNNVLLRKLVNLKNKLWIKHENDGTNKTQKTCIDRVCMISRSSEDIIRLYQESSFVALTLTPDVFLKIAKDIARALLLRHQKDGSGLKILVLMNQPNCDQFVSKAILDELKKISKDQVSATTIWSNIEFIPTVVDRIVSPITTTQVMRELKDQLQGIPTHLLKQTLHESNVDNIFGQQKLLIQAIDQFDFQFAFFKAEFNFSMYVPDHFSEAYRFPLMRKCHDLSMFETIKSVYINGPHAVLAWFGALLGFETIAEAIKHPTLFSFIKRMMEKEIGPILLKEYPSMKKTELEALEASFIKRCRASVDDRVTRVGQDPLRKLNFKGRIRYPIELAEKHNLKIDTSCLLNGIAAGFLYGIKKIDRTDPGCQKINELYEINKHSLLALLRYKGPAPGGNFIGLSDDKLVNNVMNKITLLNRMSDKINLSL